MKREVGPFGWGISRKSHLSNFIFFDVNNLLDCEAKCVRCTLYAPFDGLAIFYVTNTYVICTNIYIIRWCLAGILGCECDGELFHSGFSAFNCAIAYIVICDQWKKNAVRPSSSRIPRERESKKLKKI